MILFFDRSIGVTIPRILRQLELPIGIEIHEENFSMEEADDVWLPVIGQAGWFVIGHDHSYHKKLTEWTAIEQYKIGCFYMWGSEAPVFQTLRAFLRGYENIVRAADTLERPFIRYVDKNGSLKTWYSQV